MVKEMVLIEHKDLPDTQKEPVRVSRASFEKLWKERGWRIAKAKKD